MMHSFVMCHDPDAQPETDWVLAPYADMEIPDIAFQAWPCMRAAIVGWAADFAACQAALQRTGCDWLEPDRLCGARRFYERHGFGTLKPVR